MFLHRILGFTDGQIVTASEFFGDRQTKPFSHTKKTIFLQQGTVTPARNPARNPARKSRLPKCAGNLQVKSFYSDRCGETLDISYLSETFRSLNVVKQTKKISNEMKGLVILQRGEYSCDFVD